MMYEMPSIAKETPSLEDYLRAIRNRKWLVLGVTIAGLLLASLAAQSRTDSFEANATVLVGNTPVGSPNGNLVIPVTQNERAVLRSLPTANAVVDELGIDRDPRRLLRDLTVQFEERSTVLELSFVSTDRELAQSVVNSFAENYVDQRVEDARLHYEQSLSSLDTEIDQITVSLTDVANEQTSLERRRNDAFSIPPGTAGRQETIDAIQRSLSDLGVERSALRSRLRVLTDQRGDEARDQQSVDQPAEVLQLAPTPDSPIGLSRRLLQILGLLGGLIAGVAGAFVLDRLDKSARDAGDVELTIGSSVLGTVPPFGFKNTKGSSALIMLSNAKTTSVQRGREAFRRLRSSLQFLDASNGIRSVVITSAQPSEGKSIVSSNLAIALAQAGHSTVLVSADMRRPTLEGLMSIHNQTGLSDLLAAPELRPPPLLDVGVPNLAVLPSGPLPPNPGELLASKNFADLVELLNLKFEYVIVDTPPVLSAADSISAATSTDGVIVVVDGQKTDMTTILQVRSDLDRAGANVVGAVLNRDRSRNARIFSRRDRYAYERALSKAT